MFTVADCSVACLYVLDEFLWKMEHSRILAGLILAAFLPQGKRGIFSCAEEGTPEGMVSLEEVHWKVHLNARFCLPGRGGSEGRGWGTGN